MPYAMYRRFNKIILVFVSGGVYSISAEFPYAFAAQVSAGDAEVAPINTFITGLITGGISFIFALVLAAITGAVGYLWGRRRTKTEELLVVWRNAFDRASFRGSYTYHSDNDQFRRAISDTIKSISTGRIFDPHGNVLDRVEGIYHGPWQIKELEVRKVILEVRNRLQKIMRLSYKDPDIKKIDGERDEVIRKLNELWKKYGIETMIEPTKYDEIESLLDEIADEKRAGAHGSAP